MFKMLVTSALSLAMVVSTSAVSYADSANQKSPPDKQQDQAVAKGEPTSQHKMAGQAASPYQKAGMAAGQTQASNQGIGILNTPAIIGIAAVLATIGIAVQAASDDDKGGTGTGTSTSGT